MAVFLTVWNLLDERQRRRLAGIQLLSIIIGLSTVSGVAAVLPFFTALADPQAIRNNPVIGVVLQRLPVMDDSSLVILLGAVFAAMVLITNTVNLVGFLTINRVALRVGDTLYVRLFDEYLHRDYEFHTRNNSSVLTSRVLHDTTRVISGVLQQGLILITNLVTIACVAASMLLVNPVAAAAAILGLGGSYAAIYTLARGRLLRNGQIEGACYGARTRTVSESFEAIREITLRQARASFVRRFAQQCQSISAVIASTMAIACSPRYILECLTVCCLVGVALYLHGHSGGDARWIAQLSFVGFATYRLLPALQQSFFAVVKMRADWPAMLAIRGDLESPRRISTHAQAPAADPACASRPASEIRLCELSFRYAPDQAEVLRGVSLVIPAGAMIGFVGPNGCGKTTLFDLISGLLAPQSGHIEVDGVRLERTNSAGWQSNLSYVSQQLFLFDATLAENIALGIAPAEIDRERLERSLRLARLTECVASLPKGYQELLGEGGCRLSGGERQRLAIARALYQDASLLILDEATSSLDVAAESQIVEMLHALRPHRTILLSAHRMAALRHCDLVYELRGGKLTSMKDGRPAPRKTTRVV
jgi:ABC-type multidrug transport system fused ATPase/permease subunit